MKESGNRPRNKATGTIQSALPLPLKLFCTYLSIMLVISIGLQLLYALLVDDWSFGLKNAFTIKVLTYSGLCIVGAQHVYRVFTIVSLVRKARFAVSNAKAYLIATFAVIAVFVSSTMVAFKKPIMTKDAFWERIQIQNIGQACILIGLAFVLMFPWLMVLSRSKKVKAFAGSGATQLHGRHY